METIKDPRECITEVLAEIEAFDPKLFRIEGDAKKDETVMGPVPEWAQKAWSMWKWYSREAARMGLEAGFDPENREAARRAVEYKYKMDLIKEIAWWAIRASNGYWDDRSIGVRIVDGQMVFVSFKAQERSADLPDFLKFLRRQFEGED